jgi:3-hydroxyisobutyrate dehydrogenase
MAASSAKPSVGFIGIGLMGMQMVLKLLEDGFPVTVWNLEPEACEPVVKAGAKQAANPAAVTAAADIVQICVYDTKAVEACVFGDDRIIAAATPDKILVDHSTITQEATVRMAGELHGKSGMGWVDAPVSGGPEASRIGQLTIMAGGEAGDIQRAWPAIDCLAGNFTHMGPIGSGQATKMINQALVGVGFQLVAEAVRLAEIAGIDVEKVPACLAGGRADSSQLQACFERIAQRRLDPPTSRSKQMLKDMNLVVEYSRKKDAHLPLTEMSTDIFKRFVDAGNGDEDPVSLFRML